MTAERLWPSYSNSLLAHWPACELNGMTCVKCFVMVKSALVLLSAVPRVVGSWKAETVVVGFLSTLPIAFSTCVKPSVKVMGNGVPIYSHFLVFSASQDQSFWPYKPSWNLVPTCHLENTIMVGEAAPSDTGLGWKWVSLSSVDSRCYLGSCVPPAPPAVAFCTICPSAG